MAEWTGINAVAEAIVPSDPQADAREALERRVAALEAACRRHGIEVQEVTLCKSTSVG